MTAPLNRVLRSVQVKQKWTGEWIDAPYLEPLTCAAGVAPEIGGAQFRYSYGMVKREDSTSFNAIAPVSFNDFYVRILTSAENGTVDPVVYWTGVIQDTENRSERPDYASGTQTLQAFELGHILDRIIVKDSRAVNAPDDPQTVKVVNWVEQFNLHYKRGHRLLGNRSSVAAKDGQFVFSRETEVWTNRQIVSYLLQYFGPTPFKLSLSGQWLELSSIQEIHRFSDNESLWAILCKLVDRRRGLGFTLDCDSKGVLTVKVFSVSNVDVTIGTQTLHANDNQRSFTIPSTQPGIHEVEVIPLRKTTINKYDQIIVRGARFLVTATFSYNDNTLAEGWGGAQGNNAAGGLEAQYDAAKNPTDAAANDAYRATDTFKGVYTRHYVVENWNWNPDKVYGDDGEYATLYTDPDAMTTAPSNKADYWNGGKTFEKHLPLLINVDYSVSPKKTQYSTNDEMEYRPLLVFVKYPRIAMPGDRFAGNPIYAHVDKLSSTPQGYTNSHVRVLDSKMGFEITSHVRHFWALNHFQGAAATCDPPMLDYKDIGVTAAFRTDARLQVSADISGGTSDIKRILNIDVPGAEYWYVCKGTVIDTDDGTPLGQLDRIHDDNRVVRDDTKLLQSILAFAKAWYNVERQSVVIPLKQIDLYVPLGTLLTSINSFSDFASVNTVVTKRTTTFDPIGGDRVEIETGWGGYDVGAGILDEKKGEVAKRATEFQTHYDG